MGEETTSLDKRAEQAEKIISNPARYMICFACESIVAIKVTLCPNCHGYRFENNEASVIAQARTLGDREQRSVVSSDLE